MGGFQILSALRKRNGEMVAGEGAPTRFGEQEMKEAAS
jgi:hypothetical protein